MKKHHTIIGIICSIITLGSGMGIFVRHMFNVYISDMVGELTGVKEEVFLEEGFYDPRTKTEDSKYKLKKGKEIREEDFLQLENAEECWMEHFDNYFDDTEAFLSLHMNEWEPYDWIRTESVEYVDFEYQGDIHRYTKEVYWYSEEHGSGGIVPQFIMNSDAVTGRIHWISFTLPYEDNAKTAFLQIMNWLGYDGDAEFIFDKIVQAKQKLGQDQSVRYEKDGFDFGIGLSDYLNPDDLGPQKLYSITISPEND